MSTEEEAVVELDAEPQDVPQHRRSGPRTQGGDAAGLIVTVPLEALRSGRALGGPTDLDGLVLLCAYHHHLVHHSGWRIEMRDRRPVFVPPRWLDPDRVPRTNDVDHLVAA